MENTENKVTVTCNDSTMSTKELVIALGVYAGVLALATIPVAIASRKAKKEHTKFEKHKDDILKSRDFLDEIETKSIQNDNIDKDQKVKVYGYLMDYYMAIKLASDIESVDEALAAYDRFVKTLSFGLKESIDIKIQIEEEKERKAEKRRELDDARRKEDREFNKEMKKCNMIVDAIKAQNSSSPNTIVNVGDRNVSK